MRYLDDARFVGNAAAPAQPLPLTPDLPPAQAFGGATPSDLQRFYDEVAFYTGQPAMQQAPVARQARPAQAPLAGQPTIFDQPGALDVRQAQMQPEQPLPGEPQIMTRSAFSEEETQPTTSQGPSTEDIVQDVATDVTIEIAKDEVKSQLGIESSSGLIKGISEFFYPGSTTASTTGTTAGTGGATAGTGASGLGTAAAGAAGAAVAVYNVSDAINNISKDSRRGKGTVEGYYTIVGTVGGAMVGGAVGAGIGSIVGRTVGRGMASLGERLGFIGGRTTTQYQIDRWTAAVERAATSEEQKWGVRKMKEVIRQKESGGGAPKFKHGALAGRQYSIEDLHGMGRGEDVWGEYAFFEAFPDWLTGWTEEERRIIAEAAIREKLLTSDKGSTLFSGKHGKLARIQEIGYQVKQGTYTHAISDEQRMQDRAAYAESIGVNWDPAEDAEIDKLRAGEHMQMIAAERREEAAIRAEEQGFQKVQGRALWKPNSEKDGNLVMLFPYTVGEVTIRDADTGQVLAVGRSSGPSNGFADTIRFDRPGGAFQNVIVEDKYGNQIPISDGSQRVEGISVTGYVLPGAGVGALPNFGPPPAVTVPELKPLKKIKYKKRELPKVTYKAPKAPGAQQSKEKQ